MDMHISRLFCILTIWIGNVEVVDYCKGIIYDDPTKVAVMPTFLEESSLETGLLLLQVDLSVR